MRQNSKCEAVDLASGVTRREFTGEAIGLAAGTLGFPAIVRGRNLNEKLNIAMIGVGGRGAVEPSRRGVREHRGPV